MDRQITGYSYSYNHNNAVARSGTTASGSAYDDGAYNVSQYYGQQQQQEEFIYAVERHDVLFGGNSDGLQGNVDFQQAVEDCTDAYYATTIPHHRTEMVINIIHGIKRKGGRFLSRLTQSDLRAKNLPSTAGDLYQTVPDSVAAQSFKQGMRDVRFQKASKHIKRRGSRPRKKRDYTAEHQSKTPEELLQQQAQDKRLEQLHRRRRRRELKHKARQLGEYVYSLGQHDVVLGPGPASTQHEGNIAFRSAVQKIEDAYRAAPDGRVRDPIVLRTIADVKLKGGRFLYQFVESERKAENVPSVAIYQVESDEAAIDLFKHHIKQLSFLKKRKLQRQTAMNAQPQEAHVQKKQQPTQELKDQSLSSVCHQMPPDYAEDQSLSSSSINQQDNEDDCDDMPKHKETTAASESSISSEVEIIGVTHHFQGDVAPSSSHNHENKETKAVSKSTNDRPAPESWPAAPPPVTYTADPSLAHSVMYSTSAEVYPQVTNYYVNAKNEPTVVHHTHNVVIIPPPPLQPRLAPMYPHHLPAMRQPYYNNYSPAYSFVPQASGQTMVSQPPNPNYYTTTAAANTTHGANYGQHYGRNHNIHYAGPMGGYNMGYYSRDQHHQRDYNTDTTTEHEYAPDEPPSSSFKSGEEEDYRPAAYQSRQDEEESRPNTTSSAFDDAWFEEEK